MQTSSRFHCFRFCSLLLPIFALAGCGYSFQGSKNELLEKRGVERVYVKPFLNNSFKVGVENTVYNSLVKTLLSQKRVKVVNSKEEADAVIEGTVYSASFNSVGFTSADRLAPLSSNLPSSQMKIPEASFKNFSVATVLNASLSCNFALKRRVPRPSENPVLWSNTFSLSKPFPASNQLDVPGTTSALINESEFDRALGDMATAMMADVHESMLGLF